MLPLLALCAFVAVPLVRCSTQETLKIPSHLYPSDHTNTSSGSPEILHHDTALFMPFENLNLLSTNDFTTLTHYIFPKHSVRIKKSDFCDGTVNAYTGYIDIEARHLFFYFFESRRNPDEDDVMLWTNGGPGCSSAVGLFMELGPCRVENVNKTTFNPYSWNDRANIFFIDQPVGVGYSYAEYGETVGNTEDAAKDIAAFMAIFFEHFTKFKGRSFHMAGESYAGRYVPLFAAEVYDQNARLVEAGLTPINLTSMLLGNGLTEAGARWRGGYEMQCTSASLAPINTISNCVRMRQMLPRCEKMFKESCSDILDAISCSAAISFCWNVIELPEGINPYDLSKKCEGELRETLCYPITKDITNFLNRNDIREILGVDPTIGNFSSCNNEKNAQFNANLDSVYPTPYYVTGLLERGVKVLVYVGANDFRCNWISNEMMTLNLDWTGKEAFNSQPLKEWNFNGSAAGLTRSAGLLTFATIYDAGHMVPYDKPEASLELVNKWLAGESL
ncbi:hypothetical protein QCA50_006883 [Cerrena zonata]|uniref:Carboxypeptidase n=1 Tax=Cerrena zonata TaxID=2478898 RepID=A0AAW0GGC9_9APHY